MDLTEGTDTMGVVDGVDPGNGFLRCFGRQMKLLREAAGLTQAELGARVGYGEAQIASVEQGRRIPKPELVDAVDRVVGGNGLLSAMKGEVVKARYPGFFRQYAQLEAQATKLNAYDSHVVKGLLQTEDYARAVFEMWRPILDAETVDQRVAARMDRQKLFAKRPGAAHELRHRGSRTASAAGRAPGDARAVGAAPAPRSRAEHRDPDHADRP
nr:Scr1 family TA system antitoxin-like transcriptional regulator [Streptomyces somaliensis]